MEEERKKAEDEAKRRMEEERRAFAEARKSMVGITIQINTKCKKQQKCTLTFNPLLKGELRKKVDSIPTLLC